MHRNNNFTYLVIALFLLSFTFFPFLKGISPTGDFIPRFLVMLLAFVLVEGMVFKKSFIYLIVYYFYILVVQWDLGIVSHIGGVMEFAIPLILSNILIYSFSGKEETLKERKLLSKYSFWVIVITIISSSIVMMFIDPLAIRKMVGFSSDGTLDIARQYNRMGVCEYDFASMCMCVPAVFIYLFRTSIKVKDRVFYFVFALIALYFMYLSQVTTTLIICAFITAVAFFTNPKSQSLMGTLIVSGILSLLIIAFLPDIYNVIAPYIKGTNMESRIGGFVGDGDDSDWLMRRDLYQTSWNIFAANVLFGSPTSSIGGHAYFVDRLALYGIVGFIPLVGMLVSQFRAVIKILDSYQSKIYIVCCAGLIILGFLKNMTGMCYWLFIFVLIPAILLSRNNKHTIK